MAAVRLPKAFRYPEDSDEDREELVEQEQEQLIQQLQRQNDARNAQYNVNIDLPSTIPNPHFSLLETNHLSKRILDHLHKHPACINNRLLTLGILSVQCDGMALVAVGGSVPRGYGIYHASIAVAPRSQREDGSYPGE